LTPFLTGKGKSNGIKHEAHTARLHASFKLSFVDQVEQGELTYKEAQRRYGIQGRSTVLVWLRKHGRQRWAEVASSACMSHFATTDASSIVRMTTSSCTERAG
jgi:transposase-like protein